MKAINKMVKLNPYASDINVSIININILLCIKLYIIYCLFKYI